MAILAHPSRRKRFRHLLYFKPTIKMPLIPLGNGGGPGAGSPVRDPLGNRLEFSFPESGSSAPLVFCYCLGGYAVGNTREKARVRAPGSLTGRAGGAHSLPGTRPSRLLRTQDRRRSPSAPWASGHLGWPGGACVRVRVCGPRRKRCPCTSTGGRRKTTWVLEKEIHKDPSREQDSLCIHHLSQPIYLGSISDVTMGKKKIVG